MEKIKAVFNKKVNTLDVWFDDSSKEFISEETGEEVILKKDKKNRVIGFEKLNVLSKKVRLFPLRLLRSK